MKYFLTMALMLTIVNTARCEILNIPSAVVVTSSDGRYLRKYMNDDGVMREAVALDKISPWLILASLAAEDKRFFEHKGVDVFAIARAVKQNIAAGKIVSGASTITQQLYRAYNNYPHTFLKKIDEAFEAVKLEKKYTKEQILSAYLNMIPYGNNCAGAQSASLLYFGINASDLSLSQAAALAGIPRAPSLYNPYKAPELFETRRLSILKKMYESGYIDQESFRLAVPDKPKILPPKFPFYAPHFSNYVAKNVKNKNIIRSTLNTNVQNIAVNALKNHIAALNKKQHVTNGAVIVLDNLNGNILAWVGSKDFFDEKSGGQNDGVTALRQPGSALKPFLYALAFANGYTPSSLISDEPVYGEDGYSPLNYDKQFHGYVRLREALACSYNIPAVKLASALGVDKFLAVLRSFGFYSLKKDAEFYGSGLSLGNGEVTLLELAQGFSILARGGIYLPVNYDADNKIYSQKRVFGESESYLVNSILSDNKARTAAFGEDSPMHMPFTLAAKTGTSKDYRDNWTVGYTPEWTVAVWTGNFDGSAMRKVSGVTGAAPIMREIALNMYRLYGATDFNRPEDIQELEVCEISGKLSGGNCNGRITEYFKKSNMPGEVCDINHDDIDSLRFSEKSEFYIKFPNDGDVFKINPSYPREAQALLFKSSANKKVTWFIDGKKLKDNTPWLLSEGKHKLFCKYGKDKSKTIEFTVVK